MTNIDINQVIFSRTAPAKKLEIINKLTETQLFSVKKETFLRILKEVGYTTYKRDKRLFLSRERKVWNNWNSEIDGIETIKNKLYVEIYLQYENTDTSTCVSFDEFFSSGDYRGDVRRDDRYGNPRSYYFTYRQADKANGIRAILLEYVYTKYAAKLQKTEP